MKNISLGDIWFWVKETLWTMSLYNRCPRCGYDISQRGYSHNYGVESVRYECNRCDWNKVHDAMQ